MPARSAGNDLRTKSGCRKGGRGQPRPALPVTGLLHLLVIAFAAAFLVRLHAQWARIAVRVQVLLQRLDGGFTGAHSALGQHPAAGEHIGQDRGTLKRTSGRPQEFPEKSLFGCSKEDERTGSQGYFPRAWFANRSLGSCLISLIFSLLTSEKGSLMTAPIQSWFIHSLPRS